MKTNDQQMVVILGEDSSASATVAQKATLRTHALTLAGRYGGAVAENTVLVLHPSSVDPSRPSVSLATSADSS
jgi:hypothetical protein